MRKLSQFTSGIVNASHSLSSQERSCLSVMVLNTD